MKLWVIYTMRIFWANQRIICTLCAGSDRARCQYQDVCWYKTEMPKLIINTQLLLCRHVMEFSLFS